MIIRGTLLAIFMAAALGFSQNSDGYRPGQTFSTRGGNAQPQQQQYRQVTPVPYYPPVQQVPARTPVSTPRSQSSTQSTPYNMPASTPKKAVSTPVKSSVSSQSKPADSVKKAASTPRPSAPVETKKTETQTTAQSKPVRLDSPPQGAGNTITRHRTGKKLIALTYDDGPTARYTLDLMEWLKSNDVAATFYVCGNRVKENPTAVKTLAENGFEIANHTFDHPLLPKLSKEKIRQQLSETHRLVKEAAGVEMTNMRPPYGAKNQNVVDVCKELGYQIILWDVDTEDWRKRSTDQMMNTVRKLTGDGSIILMHDRLHGGKNTVLETTKQTVAEYRAKGYTFVTVSELLATDGNASAAAPKPSSALSRIQSSISSSDTVADDAAASAPLKLSVDTESTESIEPAVSVEGVQ